MTFFYGVDYYPEHWPVERHAEYASLMRNAGFNVVRLAEFAWILMEPKEGQFEFQWLDSAIKTLSDQGISIVLGTPTAAMPAWVKSKYPDVMASSDGHHRDAWGVRKNNCFSSETFRRLSKAVTQAMATHYVGSSAVIGWQTDNEIDGPECKCSACTAEFSIYLERKYGTLDALNSAWGTQFWGHVYSDWSEIQVPTNYQNDNPSLCLDWKRFHTFLQVRFQADQTEILRKTCPNHFITHNFMGTNNQSNCYELAEGLDFASYDSYPEFREADNLIAHFGTGLSCDITRGLKNKPFWIMETTAGPIGWSEFSRLPRPGEMRKFFFQHVAHGADGQLFFRWRTCTSGREQYWHGLLGHDGKPGRRYDEAKQIGKEIASIASAIDGTVLKPDVAIIYDYDSRWATEFQPSFKGNNYLNSFRRYYDAFSRAGVNVDIVPASASFSTYRVVVAPQLYVLPDEVALRLSNFVESGGILLADLRTAVKDETGLAHQRTLPGLLSTPLGIEISEYEALSGEYQVVGEEPISGEYQTYLYADWIVPKGAQTLAAYRHWHLVGYSAVTRNDFGSGVGYYVGTVVKDTTFYDKLIAAVLSSADILPILTPPAGVEVSVRESGQTKLIFVINHNEEPTAVAIPHAMRDLLSNTVKDGEILLNRFEVLILEIVKP